VFGHEHRRADRDEAHVLDAAGHDEVAGAAHHGLGGEVHGLLGRAALAVDGGARHLLGQPRGQPRGAGDVAGLGADGVDAAEDHVLDRARVHARAVHEGVQRVRPQVGRVHVGQAAAPPAHRSPHRIDDVRLGHGRWFSFVGGNNPAIRGSFPPLRF
jgi:hypothetical protein